MADSGGVVLSLVERGWAAARARSLELSREGVGSIHLVKGGLSCEARELIEPKPGIQLVSVPRQLFWPAAALLYAWLVLRWRLRAVLVDNERSLRRMSRWPARPAAGISFIRGDGETGAHFQ